MAYWPWQLSRRRAAWAEVGGECDFTSCRARHHTRSHHRKRTPWQKPRGACSGAARVRLATAMGMRGRAEPIWSDLRRAATDSLLQVGPVSGCVTGFQPAPIAHAGSSAPRPRHPWPDCAVRVMVTHQQVEVLQRLPVRTGDAGRLAVGRPSECGGDLDTEAASSPWVLRYPHGPFSRARRRIRTRTDRTVGGRPRRFGAQVAACRRLSRLRCQRRIVSGRTSSRSRRSLSVGRRWSRPARTTRSVSVNSGLPTWSCRTSSWWRSARISISFPRSRIGSRRRRAKVFVTVR